MMHSFTPFVSCPQCCGGVIARVHFSLSQFVLAEMGAQLHSDESGIISVIIIIMSLCRHSFVRESGRQCV